MSEDWRQPPTANQHKSDKKGTKKDRRTMADLKAEKEAERGDMSRREARQAKMGPKPKKEAIMASDKKMQQFATEIKGTKLGALVGTCLFPICLPAYAYFRVNGQGREDSMNAAFKATWTVAGTLMTFVPRATPVPGARSMTPVIRLAGATMLATDSTISTMSDKEVGAIRDFAIQVGKDPEMKKAMGQAGATMALSVASGQEITQDQMVSMGKDLATTGGKVAEKKAVEEGHLSKSDVANIKSASVTASEIAASTNTPNDAPTTPEPIPVPKEEETVQA
jgi:hypothetical protein